MPQTFSGSFFFINNLVILADLIINEEFHENFVIVKEITQQIITFFDTRESLDEFIVDHQSI